MKRAIRDPQRQGASLAKQHTALAVQQVKRAAMATPLDLDPNVREALLERLRNAAKDKPIAVIHQVIQILDMMK